MSEPGVRTRTIRTFNPSLPRPGHGPGSDRSGVDRRERGEGEEVARRSGRHDVGDIPRRDRHRAAGPDEVLDLAHVEHLAEQTEQLAPRATAEAATLAAAGRAGVAAVHQAEPAARAAAVAAAEAAELAREQAAPVADPATHPVAAIATIPHLVEVSHLEHTTRLRAHHLGRRADRLRRDDRRGRLDAAA